MISKFFIDRPRFAFVISIVITLAGIVALFVLPVTQYPDITPGQVSISATYPGADAKTVQETVIQPIEAQVNGVKRMIYMSSNATDTGAATITVTFDIGTDGDSNTVNTQNRVNWASAQLPEEVRRQSVIVKEKSPSMLLVVALFSPDGRYDDLFLSNYAGASFNDGYRNHIALLIEDLGHADLLADDTFLHVSFTSYAGYWLAFANMTSSAGWFKSKRQALELDFDFNAGREFKIHQSLNGFVGRSEDVDKSLMGAHFELLTAVLILMNSAQDGDNLLLGRQRNRSTYASTGTLCSCYDLLSGLIHQLMIIPFDSYPDFFFDCHFDRLLVVVGGRRFSFPHTVPGVSHPDIEKPDSTFRKLNPGVRHKKRLNAQNSNPVFFSAQNICRPV